MKLASPALRKAYVDLLTGLKQDNAIVPVYDTEAPVKRPANYVIVRDIIDANVSLKDVDVHNCGVTLDIHTNFPASVRGTSLRAEWIANSILKKVTEGTLDLGNDFKVAITQFVDSKPLNFDNGTIKEYRRILVFKHLIQEL